MVCALVIILWLSITRPTQGLLFPSVLCVGGAYFAYSHRLVRRPSGGPRPGPGQSLSVVLIMYIIIY